MSDVGCFWETATHELAIIDYLFSPKWIRDVRGRMMGFGDSGAAGAPPAPRPLKIKDDFSSAWIDFDNAPPAQIVVSRICPEKVRRFAIIGDKGSAVFDEKSEEKLKIYFLKGKRGGFGSPTSKYFSARAITKRIGTFYSMRARG